MYISKELCKDDNNDVKGSFEPLGVGGGLKIFVFDGQRINGHTNGSGSDAIDVGYGINIFIDNSHKNMIDGNKTIVSIFDISNVEYNIYDCNKMDFIFYYYVKFYFDFCLCIPSIWSWIMINIFNELFGIFVCMLWGFGDGMLLYSIKKSVSHSY